MRKINIRKIILKRIDIKRSNIKKICFSVKWNMGRSMALGMVGLMAAAVTAETVSCTETATATVIPAAVMPISGIAATGNGYDEVSKEEVVYANLDGNGIPEGVYVVNICNGSNIVDYGPYSSVRNMNTEDKIEYSDGKVTISNSTDRLYYEGILSDTELPWKVAVTYKIDGKSLIAGEAAGMSGSLEMVIKITENTAVKKDFYDNYAVQTTVKLDSTKCSNIVSDGATQANVGSLRQLTYTILPGKGKEIRITADVTDFEMESIAVNGIKLNLGIDSGTIDTSGLNDRLSDLKDAVRKLDDGAGELNDGAGKLSKGASRLSSGINEVDSALKQMSGKSADLTKGSASVKSALRTIQESLKKVSLSVKDLETLSTASTAIRDGIDSLVAGLGKVDGLIDIYNKALSSAGLTDINTFLSQHNAAITALGITNCQRSLYSAYASGGASGVAVKLAELAAKGDSDAAALYKKYAASNDESILTEYVTNAGEFITIETLLKADIAYIRGSSQLINGIDQSLDPENGQLMTGAQTLQTSYKSFDTSIQSMVTSLTSLALGMSELKSGIDKLNRNYSTLDDGIGSYTEAVKRITRGYASICTGALDLVNGTNDLYDGTRKLTDGTGTFSEETKGLDSEVDEQIDSMMDEYLGSDFEVSSFVSDKNTNVSSVQFVIKTAAVEKPEPVEEEEAKEEPLSIWEKFLNIFR